jgi:succinoglycan biosynthesis protein ExoA
MGEGVAVKAGAEHSPARVRAQLETGVTPARVTVVVPVRDEESTVHSALESLARQTIGPAALEVLVFDGGSVDGTKDVCRAFASGYPWGRFEVFDNPQRTVPHALNLGLAESRCKWFAVIAGRTTFSPDYLEACLRELETSGPGVAVGGRFVAEAEGPVARAIAAVVTHPLGVGRGFRTEQTDTDVPHHPFAVWQRDDVLRFGAFNPELERNQDDEFSMRALSQGARIKLTHQPEIRYRPRERFRGVAVQYFQYGLWKAAVGRRYRLFPVRSLVPAAATGAFVGATALAVTGRTRLPLVGLLGGYAAVGSAIAGARNSNRVVTAAALGLVHLAYGTGVIVGAARPAAVTSMVGTTRLR